MRLHIPLNTGRALSSCLDGLKYASCLALLLTLMSCGSGDMGPAANSGNPAPSATQQTINVTVSGLSGSGLVLQNNGGDDLPVSSNGNISFASPVAIGNAYAVTVQSQPGAPAQGCTVSNGSGMVTTGAVNVLVSCVTSHFAYVTYLSATRVFSVDDVSGALTATGSSVPLGGIVAATIAPTGKFLYVADVIGNAVHAYAIDPLTGALTELSTSFPTGGSQPQAVGMTSDGKFLYAVNRASNDVSIFAVNAVTGALTPVGAPVATGMYPLAVNVTPDGKFLYVANYLGGSVSSYAINATTGALSFLAETPVATNNRFLVIDPQSRFLYVTTGGNAVYGLAIDSTTGALTGVAGSPFAAGNGAQNVAIDPLGKFLYVSNETSATVSAFTIDAATGVLTQAGSALATGGLPEGVAVDPNGKFVYVASQSINAVSSFSVNPVTGVLTTGLANGAGGPPVGIAIIGQ